MSDQNQSRVPAGVPTGGQFAASAHAESTTALGVPTEDDLDFARDTLGPNAIEDEVRDLAEQRADRDQAELAREAAGGAAIDPCWGCGKGEHEPQGSYPDTHIYQPRSEVLDAMDRADYGDARKAVERDWRLLTDGIEMLPDERRRERYDAVADHFEHVALTAANTIPANQVPEYGRTVLTGYTGTVHAAADYASQARLNAGYGAFRVEDIEAGGDRIAQKAYDTRDFTAANGVPFRARIVRRGAQWGRTGSMTATEDMVFFFDARYPDHPPMIGGEFDPRERDERNGQHVSNYHLATLREHPEGAGLDLYGGEASWKIDGQTFADVRVWMSRRAR